MNDDVIVNITISTLSIILFKSILLHSIKKVFIANEFKVADGCHCSDNVLFLTCCASVHKGKFCGEM